MRKYHTKYSRPTETQYALIGQIVCEYSISDNITKKTIARMSGAHPYLGACAVDKLSSNNKIDALKNLVAIHKIQFGCTLVSHDLCEDIIHYATELDVHRAIRNKFAHWVWMRQTDETVFGFDGNNKPTENKRQNGSVEYSLDELKNLKLSIDELIDLGVDINDELAQSSNTFVERLREHWP